MKSFNEIYMQVYKEYGNSIENLRKQARNGIIYVIIISAFIGIMLTILTNNGIFIPVFIFVIILYLARSNRKKQYIAMFKEEIIKSFIKEYSEKLDFHHTKGMPQATYLKAEFESYDIYHSEDLIVGTLEGEYPINMAEVKTQRESRDSDGDETTYTLFHGLFAEVKLNKILDACIKIRKNEISLFKGKDKIEMDSGEFEKRFNVYSTDKIMAMQLLTADIMQMLLDFKEKNRITPEITIKQDRLYIRFSTGNIFEAKLMKKSLDYTTLEKYYNVINFTLGLTENFLKNINQTEV